MTPVSSNISAMPVQAQAQPAAPEALNPYLQGNFGPVSEERTLSELRVRGELPKALTGTLLRNGPNPAAPVEPNHHWFTGDAMLHAIRIEGGRALSYRNRWVRTAHVEEARGLPAAPKSPFEPPVQGSGNVNVIEHAGKILALPEVGLPFEMSGTLETRRQYDFDGKLRSNMTAHPKIDPVTGELFFFGYDFFDVPLRYHVADKSGALVKTLEIKTKAPTMMHDFAITATRAIFMDMPVVFDLSMVERGLRMPFRWDDNHGARFGVMDRSGDGTDLKWVEIPSCYIFHVYNAYDDGALVVLDAVEHDKTFEGDGLLLERNYAPPRCVRYVIDAARGTCKRTVLDERGEEFPRIDPRLVGRKHRYGYAVHTAWNTSLEFHHLLKHDFETNTVEAHELEPGQAAGEGVFVPVGQGEDEGYVLAPVYDARTNTSSVRVIDAQRFGAPPVATIELPVRIPFGFHGDFVTG
jgi:carotenoid cleavage dioxygenase